MKEKLYHKAPYIFKVIILNIKAFLNKKNRYNEFYDSHLINFKSNWTKSFEDLKLYQKEHLRDLLLEVLMFVPYYRDVFNDLGIEESDIRNDPFNVISRLPLLSKKDRKIQVNNLINSNPQRETAAIGFTSGTSGSPTKNYLDKESLALGFALWDRFHFSIGVNKNEKSVRFSGRLIVNSNQNKPPFWVMSYVDKQLFMSSYHLKKEYLNFYIDKLNDFRPHFLDGYPSTFYILAKYIVDNKIKLNFIPKAIATTAETLYDYQKVAIENAFNCRVYNQYASSEGSPFITECLKGNLHVNMDSGIFEFLNKNNEPASEGEIARMVVTSFRNYKVPLIRYDIEDTVLLSSEDFCECGCQMPIVEKIIGREDDILWTEEKGYVGRMDPAYKGLEGIVQSQIIQVDKLNFIVKNVVDDLFDVKMEELLISNLKERLGSKILIRLERVEKIPLGANGKFEAVKRKFEIDI